MIALINFPKSFLSMLVVAVFAFGCSKKPAQKVEASPSSSAVEIDANAARGSFDQSITEADAAARNGDCLKALQSLLALEKQQMTQQQSQRLKSQFASLKEKLNEVITREPFNPDALEAMNIMKRQNR